MGLLIVGALTGCTMSCLVTFLLQTIYQEERDRELDKFKRQMILEWKRNKKDA